MNQKQFLLKTKELFIGKRTLKQRFSTAFWPALILSFILLLYGPLDLSHIAETYVSYTVPDILPSCLRLFFLGFAGLFLFLIIPGGSLHSALSSFITGLAIAFYIQGNWLNNDLGVLDGTAVQWDQYGDNAIISLVIFLLILSVPFLVRFYSRKIWRKFVIFICMLLLIMQGIPLGLMLVQEYRSRPPAEHYVMKKDEEYVLGQENIVVFILDQTAPTHIRWLNRWYPDALSPFHDFTSFTNMNTTYMGTFPASTYLLTHEPYDISVPVDEWFKTSWHAADAETFYSQMQADGWEIRVFNSAKHAAGTLQNEYGKISNVEKVETRAEFTISRSAFKKLIKLSFYRYFPFIMKAPFWIYTGDLDSMKSISDDERTWNRIDSVQKFLETGITLGDAERVYITYHWAGAHAPYSLNAEGKAVRTSNQMAQLAGHFYVISQYLQQMKDLGIYDSSTIIITADHGDFDDPNSIFYIKPAGQRQDQMTYNNAPISQEEFMATVSDAAGLEAGQFGRSVFEIPEDESRERCTFIRWTDPDLPGTSGKSTNAIQEYCYTGHTDTVIQMIKDGNYISYPLPYPWY